ncbi:hypothetical protein FD755_010934 [Muntiacus reevesi]|uniref:Uncharacterized protein n=1 Tax=Muntiacus reevesi TaxID=9886 RepID=A0A5N3XRC9_MUNRE|nr:hypothetical protein FD755_010934 [Muntiacus reevesi]
METFNNARCCNLPHSFLSYFCNYPAPVILLKHVYLCKEAELEIKIKMQQVVVDVLETNARSKKCNPGEAGLYKLKARTPDSRILYGGPILPKKPPEKPLTVPVGFDLDFEIEKRIKHVPRPPAFVRKKRTPKPNQEDEDGEQPIVVRAQQPPHYGESFQPKIPVRRTAEIRPFSFGSKESLTEENKATEERGGDRVLGLSFLPLTCRR